MQTLFLLLRSFLSVVLVRIFRLYLTVILVFLRVWFVNYTLCQLLLSFFNKTN